MPALKDMVKRYVSLSYNELLDLAKTNLQDLIPFLTNHFRDNDISTKFLMILTSACLDVDGEITDLEISFLNNILGTDHDRDSLHELSRPLSNQQCRDVVYSVADALDSDGKAHLISLCLCILAVDETITRKETAFITKLIK